jgi:hypothetical protein
VLDRVRCLADFPQYRRDPLDFWLDTLIAAWVAEGGAAAEKGCAFTAAALVW